MWHLGELSQLFFAFRWWWHMNVVERRMLKRFYQIWRWRDVAWTKKWHEDALHPVFIGLYSSTGGYRLLNRYLDLKFSYRLVCNHPAIWKQIRQNGTIPNRKMISPLKFDLWYSESRTSIDLRKKNTPRTWLHPFFVSLVGYTVEAWSWEGSFFLMGALKA